MLGMPDHAFQQCISPSCRRRYSCDESLFACRACGSLLDICYDWSRCEVPQSLSFFEKRWATPGRDAAARADFSGVWRFRELLPFASLDDIVTLGEGRTQLQQADDLALRLGMKPVRLYLQYEGFNPSGSFKDNGMAAAFTIARKLNRRRVGCASTGNTSASMAMYAAQTMTRTGESIQAVVFVGGGKIAFGKLAQALDFGATTLQIDGDFDACMSLVQQGADRLDLYLMNSVNPFRLEGQKTIIYRVLEGLGWRVPDWIIVPGGNLGNSSAFGKAFMELRELGLIDRIPRLAVINASGANTLSTLWNKLNVRYNGGQIDREKIDRYYAEMTAEGRKARTIASAIEIACPVNLPKALRALEAMNGVVRDVSDEAILDAKSLVGRHGFGCEPASAASVAGLQMLLADRTIAPTDEVVCILTGHALKDPDATVTYHQPAETEKRRPHANPPQRCAADINAIIEVLGAQDLTGRLHTNGG